MSFKLNAALAACLTLLSNTAHAEGDSTSLLRLIEACAKNVMCSNQKTAEGTLFKLRHQQRTQNLLCKEDGNCVTILAKGQRIKIMDSLTQISAK